MLLACTSCSPASSPAPTPVQALRLCLLLSLLEHGASAQMQAWQQALRTWQQGLRPQLLLLLAELGARLCAKVLPADCAALREGALVFLLSATASTSSASSSASAAALVRLSSQQSVCPCSWSALCSSTLHQQSLRHIGASTEHALLSGYAKTAAHLQLQQPCALKPCPLPWLASCQAALPPRPHHQHLQQQLIRFAALKLCSCCRLHACCQLLCARSSVYTA